MEGGKPRRAGAGGSAGSELVFPGATGDTGPAGLSQDLEGNARAPSPGARRSIPNPEPVMAEWMPAARRTLVKTQFMYQKLEQGQSKGQGLRGCLEA